MIPIGASNARERAIADSQFGGGATTWAPATWYLGISTTVPNDDGTNFTEPVGGSYARPAFTNNVTNFPAAVTVANVTTKSNGTKFTFTNPTGLWNTAVYYGWFTAVSGGTPEYTNQLDAPVTIRSGNTPVEFDIGQLVMEFD